MKKSAIITLVGLVAITLGVTTYAQNRTNNEEVHVGILQIVPHGSLDAARKGFENELKTKLKASGDKRKVVIDYQNAQGDQGNLKMMSKKLVDAKPDVLLGIATPAAQALAQQTKKLPIVVTAVTDLKSASLVKENAMPATNVTGTSDLAPLDEQLALITKLKQNAKPVAVLYNPAEANSAEQVKQVQAYARAHHLPLLVKGVSSTNDVKSTIDAISGRVSGIYIPTDNLMASSMKTVGKLAIAAKLPVVTGSIEMAQDGGVATYGIDYEKLGAQAADMAAQIITDKQKPAKMAVQMPRELSMYVNKTTAKALGIKPAEIKVQ